MSKLGIEKSSRNGEFFERIARYNQGVKIDVEGDLIVLTGKKIDISREVSDEVLTTYPGRIRIGCGAPSKARRRGRLKKKAIAGSD